jgi:endonuclease/exonuclease/phosphatase family metal-dependent hydrolase
MGLDGDSIMTWQTLSVVVVLLAVVLAAPPDARADGPTDLRVMSFNIRYGTAADGEDHWEKRRELLFATIEAFKPDLLGTQEVLAFQADELKKRLTGYEFVGAGRDDGKDKGEMTPIYFRTDRFEKLDEGHFWLSETPGKPGSQGWDAALPRVASWVKLRDKATKREFYFYNTHFDHRGQKARLESAKLVRKQLGALPGNPPIVLTGDFNSGEGTEPYQALAGGEGVKLIDSYRAVHPTRAKDEGTFHGFQGTRTGARIDWVLHTEHFAATAAAIDHTSKAGRYPSDHFAVTVTLNWK